MNRITLTILFTAAVGTAGGAQTPPAAPVRPVPAPKPAPAPRAVSPSDFTYNFSYPDIDEIRANARAVARATAEIDREAIRASTEAVRAQSAQITEWARENARWSADMTRDLARAVAPVAAMEFPRFDVAVGTSAPRVRFSEDFRVPRPFFQQGEPADSMYRLAHDALNRGDYGRAASLFKEVSHKYPKSIYENDLPYWEAFARYRIGTTDELKNAVKLLEPRASKLIGVVQQGSSLTIASSYDRRGRGTSDAEATALYIRINTALASRGDNGAASVIAKAAQSGANICDREDMQIKTEAINALSQMDPAQAMTAVRRVLEKKDDCSIELRRRAVFILGRRGDSEAAGLLATAAKSDPSIDVRTEAISWLPKVQGEAGVNMLEELLRTDQEERIQRAVVRTLTSSDNQRARASMRALIDRKDAPTNLRVEAVNAFNSDRATSEDAAYLRSAYGRVDNERVKDAVIQAVARIGGPENDQWILNLAKNSNEPSQFRATAIGRLMRSNTIGVGDLIKLYDASDTYDIRRSLVSVLENRKEPEAADKLVDIVRNGTVLPIRNQALNALKNRKDPRSAQLYLEILDGKKP